MLRRLLASLTGVLFILSLSANDETKFKVLPSGRVLIDGALYASPEKYMFKDGLAIPEARLGAKFFYGNWSSWIDVGIAYGKIGLRNMWIQYDFNDKNSIRFGNFLMPFGYQSPTTANNKPTFEQPLASALFTPGLQLGAMYTFKNKNFYSATAFHVESNALTNVMNYPLFNQQGYSFLTRFVWRKYKENDNNKPFYQAGISLGFSSPEKHLVGDYDVHNAFTNSAYFPTKVSSVIALSSTIDQAKNRFKLSPEILFSYKRIALESQYFFQTISRRNNLSTCNAQGFYVTLRGVLIGTNYSYDSTSAILSHPKKNSLEFVADYNYSNLTDSFSGKANSVTMTLNYYFNPYITARLNYTYTKVSEFPEGTEFTHRSQNAFQVRLMLLF